VSTAAQVAVVIPVRLRRAHDPADLARCLAALAACRPAPAQVIVVDDGSSPPVQLPAPRPPDTALLRIPPSGPGPARNAGAAATTQPVLVFLDADVVVPPDAIGRLQALLDGHPQAAAAWATVSPRHPEGGLVSRYKLHTHRHFTLRLGAGPGPWTTPHLTTMLAAVRRPAFETIGGFSPAWHTVSIEDVELGRDLVDQGFTLLLDPELQVVHAHRFDLASAARNDVHKLRRLVTATLGRRRRRGSSVEGGTATDGRMRRYALGVPLGVGAVAAAGVGALPLSGALLLGLALSERDLLRYLAAEEGPSFALACLPLIALERCTAATAAALGLADYLGARSGS